MAGAPLTAATKSAIQSRDRQRRCRARNAGAEQLAKRTTSIEANVAPNPIRAASIEDVALASTQAASAEDIVPTSTQAATIEENVAPKCAGTASIKEDSVLNSARVQV